MRRLTSRNCAILTLILVITVFTSCGIACVLVYLFVASWNDSIPDPYRDDILTKVPIYPNATLVKGDEIIGDRTDGWTERAYQTADAFEDVMKFYANLSPPCDPITFREVDDMWACMGDPGGDDRGFYEARLKHLNLRPT
ncbi:MAG: hypothetical protein HY866_01910 [Chloroflexi bacterium]|nr:hypothetical protein [Chloroflexota bacterium]